MPFGLTLGLTNPPRTSLPEESLGFRGIGFSPMFSLLKPTFSLLLRPYSFSLVLQPKTERSPTDIIYISHSVGKLLSPVHFRRKCTRPVSYYALFKGLLLLSKPPGCLSTLTTFRT